MILLTKRSGGYQCGFVVFVIGAVAFVTGFAGTQWGRLSITLSLSGGISNTVSKTYFGLWTTCSESDSGSDVCKDADQYSDWLTSVRGLQCTALSIMLLSLCYAGVVNCLLDNAKFLRVLEAGGGISGVLGLIGAIVFAVKAGSDYDESDTRNTYVNRDFSLGWSFGVNVGGAVLILLSSVLIAYFNKPLEPPAAANSPGMVFNSINGGGMPLVTVSGVGPTAPVPMGNNPYVRLADSYAPPTYPALQDQGQS